MSLRLVRAPVIRGWLVARTLGVALVVCAVAGVEAQQPPQPPMPPQSAAPPGQTGAAPATTPSPGQTGTAPSVTAPPGQTGTAPSPAQAGAPARPPALEPKAIEILKASSARLAAAKTMSFTAVTSYESPSRLGPPLVYTTRSEVTMQRPNKLRVITPGDGPASEFYYDGKTMMAYSPAENLVAVAPAPPTLDAALKAAFESAAIYFPFSDLVVADPYKDIADGLVVAFYIGQSREVGGTTTDMVAFAHDDVLVQVWIGAQDKLPRRSRAIYRNDPSQLRHQMELSKWKLDGPVPTGTFTSARAAAARRIPFALPEPVPGAAPSVATPPAKTP